jgi:DNA-binding CsgD family transcriptional regulator
VRQLLRKLTVAVRDWPTHRYVAAGLLAGLVLPDGTVTVSIGHLWSPAPAFVHALLVAAQILLLWWCGGRPLLALGTIGGSFLLGQAFTRPASTADLAIIAMLVLVGARLRARTALAGAAVFATALAAFMAAAQSPSVHITDAKALLPAALLVSVPLGAGMTYRRAVRRTTVLRAPDSGDGRTAAAPSGHPQPAGLRLPVAVPEPTDVPERPHGAALTARERVVLGMVAEGLTNAEIAAALTIGRETVKTHVGNILGKLGARDRTHAVTIAHRRRLIDAG